MDVTTRRCSLSTDSKSHYAFPIKPPMMNAQYIKTSHPPHFPYILPIFPRRTRTCVRQDSQWKTSKNYTKAKLEHLSKIEQIKSAQNVHKWNSVTVLCRSQLLTTRRQLPQIISHHHLDTSCNSKRFLQEWGKHGHTDECSHHYSGFRRNNGYINC